MEHAAPLGRICDLPLLDRLVQDAFEVPFYRQWWSRLASDVRAVRQLPFHALPVVRKDDLLRSPLPDRLNARHARRPRIVVTSSGSTGQPFEVHVDRRTLWHRRRRTWRGLRYAGYRPLSRLVWLEHLQGRTKQSSLIRDMLGLRYVGVDAGDDQIIEAYLARRADVVYGQYGAMAHIAQLLADRGPARRPQPRLLIGFGEQLTARMRSLITRELGAPITEFYGLAEVGLIACRRPGEQYFTLPQDDLLVEFEPAPAPGLERLIVTDLRGGLMPFVRYDTGDLVRRDETLPGRPIVEIAGREFDVIVMGDGRRIAPYRIDGVLDEIPGLREYRLVQQEDGCVVLTIACAGHPVAEVEARCRKALADLCGPALQLQVVTVDHIAGSAAEKLHVIQSRRPDRGQRASQP